MHKHRLVSTHKTPQKGDLKNNLANQTTVKLLRCLYKVPSQHLTGYQWVLNSSRCCQLLIFQINKEKEENQL